MAPALFEKHTLEIMREIMKKVKMAASKMCDAKDGKQFITAFLIAINMKTLSSHLWYLPFGRRYFIRLACQD